jgi:hypothetical protein
VDQRRILRDKTAKTWDVASKKACSRRRFEDYPVTLWQDRFKSILYGSHVLRFHIAKDCGEQMNTFFKTDLPVDMYVLIAGAILADVAKLLEYEMNDGKSVRKIENSCVTL